MVVSMIICRAGVRIVLPVRVAVVLSTVNMIIMRVMMMAAATAGCFLQAELRGRHS